MASTHRDEISRLELLHAAHPDGLVFPHLADAYRRAGRYAQAESVLTAGLRHHADYSSAHVVLGRLRLDQGKRAEAETAFQQVLDLDPQNQVALEHLGRLCLEQDRLEEALARFRDLARLKPDDELEAKILDLEQRLGRAPAASPAPSPSSPPSPAPSPGGTAPANGRPARAPAEEEDDPPPLQLPEPGEVVTETMAELYARQGLHHRAAAVYRQLLDRSPGDQRLRSKLDVAEDALRHGGTAAATAAGPLEAEASAAVPGEADRAPVREPGSAVSNGAPASESPSLAGPSIRMHLEELLTWSGGGAAAVPGSETGWESNPQPEAEPQLEAEPQPERVMAARGRPRSRRLSPYEPWADAGVTGSAKSAAVGAGVGPQPSGAPEGEREPGGWEAEWEVADESVPEQGASPSPPQAGPEISDTVDPRARALIALTDMLVGLLEYRDPFFRGSSSLTRLLAANVAEEMGLSAGEKVDLSLAAVLRDLGRLAMGGRLVPGQQSKTPEARRKIERHVDLALHLLEGIDLPREVRLAVRHHHERWDGGGYPDGLAGEGIPRLARVLAAVDSFTAMVSPRSYRLPRKVSDAARELREGAGAQYDPVVVDALTRVLARRDQPHLGFDQRPHILLVNPDQPGAVVTAAKLCSAGYLAEVSSDPTAARERLRRVPVSALVVSAENGEEATAAFVRSLRIDPLFAALPVVVVEAPTVGLRVRLLETGADVCFPPGTSYAELRGTLGALVRRTLQSTRADSDEGASPQEAPWLALQGDVEDFPLTWLLQVMKYDSRTAAVGIRTASEDGAIYLEKGDAVHAQVRGGAKGEAALRRMLGWKKGRFTVQPEARPRERTIDTSIMHLLLTQAVDEDHAAAGVFGAVSAES